MGAKKLDRGGKVLEELDAGHTPTALILLARSARHPQLHGTPSTQSIPRSPLRCTKRMGWSLPHHRPAPMGGSPQRAPTTGLPHGATPAPQAGGDVLGGRCSPAPRDPQLLQGVPPRGPLLPAGPLRGTNILTRWLEDEQRQHGQGRGLVVQPRSSQPPMGRRLSASEPRGTCRSRFTCPARSFVYKREALTLASTAGPGPPSPREGGTLPAPRGNRAPGADAR